MPSVSRHFLIHSISCMAPCSWDWFDGEAHKKANVGLPAQDNRYATVLMYLSGKLLINMPRRSMAGL
jgi:hypothetical protein